MGSPPSPSGISSSARAAVMAVVAIMAHSLLRDTSREPPCALRYFSPALALPAPRAPSTRYTARMTSTIPPHTDTWRLLRSEDAPMGQQLALSEGLLACLPETRRPTLRWDLASQPALVVGNGQKPGIADLAICRERGIAVLRRTSGGAAVLVDATAVNMEVVLPERHPLATSDVVRAYEWIGELWAEALRSLGIARARAIPVEEVRAIPPLTADDPLRLACFGTLSPWEVVVGKRKLVGLCQVRRRPGTLYQAGVYLHLDPKALGELLDLNNNRRKTLGT